jgi:hypothetical protein
MLVISDGNNFGCRYYRKAQRKEWERIREQELPYRVAFIREQFPDIDPEYAASLALHTELYSREATATIVAQAIQARQLPMSLYFPGNPPVYFETGVWVERAFYPPDLVRLLHGYGFDAFARIYVGGARGALHALVERMANRLPDRLAFALRPSFRCYGRKISPPSYLIEPT